MDPESPSPDEHGYKRCPDCAEPVRAAARKCRFCGYRFDRPRERVTATTRQAREPARRRRDGPRDVRELLEEWETELRQGEEVAFFLPTRAKLDARQEHELLGYLLVTDRRLVMLAPPARGMLALLRRDSKRDPAEIALELRLSDIADVVVERRWRRAELRLDDHVRFREIPAEQLERIRAHIEAQQR